MSDSNFINELKTELQKAVGGRTALAEVTALKPRVAAIEKVTVVETWKSGDSWYRKWSDGYIEQGGKIQTATGSNGKYTVTFHKPMTQVLCIGGNPLVTYSKWLAYVTSTSDSVTSTGFTSALVTGSDDTHSGTWLWQACGYL